jgi:hypothetical protein
MIKDINIEKVEDVAIAIIPDAIEELDPEWGVYLVNMKDDPIEGVLISSNGYGNLSGKNVKTSTLRHFWDKILPNQFVKIELIETKLFSLNNEFWVSFWHRGVLYDKRYVFVTESIVEDNFTQVPVIEKRGVMIK